MTQVLIDRELLERVVKAAASNGASSVDLVDGWKAMAQIRAILANPTQQGEAAEVVAWRSRLIDPPQNNPRWQLDYFQDNAPWVESEPLMTVAQHQRILAGVRQQLAERDAEIMEQCRLNGMGAERELKLLTQRGKLARLLDRAVTEVGKTITPELRERIDAALSELTP